MFAAIERAPAAVMGQRDTGTNGDTSSPVSPRAKKPTWQNAQRHSAKSAYSLTRPQLWPGCALYSLPMMSGNQLRTSPDWRDFITCGCEHKDRLIHILNSIFILPVLPHLPVSAGVQDAGLIQRKTPIATRETYFDVLGLLSHGAGRQWDAWNSQSNRNVIRSAHRHQFR